MELLGTYNLPLVVVSILAAIGSSLVAISVVPRIYYSESNRSLWAWIIAFGLSFGAGTWTMHFIAILAFALPISVKFNLLLTMISLMLPVVVSALAIFLLRSGGELSKSKVRIFMLGLLMGLGIVGMHYIGIAALQLNASMQHNYQYQLTALVLGTIASVIILYLGIHIRKTKILRQLKVKVAGAMVIGSALSAMHYTAMQGMTLYVAEDVMGYNLSIQPIMLVIFIIIIAFLIQGGVIVTAIFDENASRSRDTIRLIKQRSNTNKTLADILVIALKKKPIQQKMQDVLETLVKLNWLSSEQAGAIFMTTANKQLIMVAQYNLPAEVQSQCSHINFGECLCGMAAETQELVFKDCVDCYQDRETYHCMDNHGYYCVPVIFEGEVLAVVNLLLESGHQKREEEQLFLTMVADALATMITSHQTEDNAKKILTAIDQAGEAVLIFDVKGMIEYTNRAFTEITGYDSEEVVGKDISVLKSESQGDAFYQNLWSTITTGEVWSGEVLQERKDKTLYPCLLTVSPSRNSSNEITHYVTIHEDLSEKKELESQFRQAQKMEAVGILVGGIAHDFNNMLAAITANLFLAKKFLNEPDKVLKKINNVEQVSTRAAGMIKQLLTFARKDMVKMVDMSLPELMKESMTLIKSSLPENISLNQELCADDIQVVADKSLLQQVLMNLVMNARDALGTTKNPSVTVGLKPYYADEDWVEKNSKFKIGNYAHISISDNGEGISEDDMSKVFEPFFTTKELGKGTGLGLAMVFGAVQSHSGIIQVDSESGKGTAVHIYLPMIENFTEQMMEDEALTFAEAKGETILFADDELYVREGTGEVLESLGYKVLQAEDGLQALEIFQAHQQEVSLVVLDVVMPHLGGVELAEKLRAINPELPVILMTGYDRENVLKDKDMIENSKLLMKPVNFNVLSFTIRGLLDSK